MQLKRSMELTPYDLPRIESPFLAAAEVGWLISSGHLSRADLTALLRVRPDSREPLQILATKQVADGDLFLIHGPFDPGPLSPVIDWRDNPELKAGGEWKPSSPLPFDLGYALQELNRRQLTPDDVKRGPAPGASGTATERTRTSDQDPARTATTATSASVMATTLAGIKLANESGQVPEEEQEPEIHVEVGIFTDGTLNNAFNSQQMQHLVDQECLNPLENEEIDQIECERRLGLLMGASYTNAPSNVAKLSDLYPEGEIDRNGNVTIQVKAYAPGPGSKTGDGDSLYGAATGLGDTGVINQVKQAFEVASSLLSTRLKGRKIRSLSVDLFGFSRGAAAARHAAYEINRGHEGLFAKLLKQLGVEPPKHLEVRFVGLFDCVAAIVNPAAGDLSAHNSKNDPVRLFLNPDKVVQAVHLTANHEHRKLFALNSLKNPDGSIPTNFREIALPGAHSDIGGGYPDSQIEDVIISPLYPIPRNRHRWPEQTVQWDNLESMKKVVEAEGWIGEYSLPADLSLQLGPDSLNSGPRNAPFLGICVNRQDHPAPEGRVELTLRMCRQIEGEYSRVGLAIMHKLAKNSGVNLKRIPERKGMTLSDELRLIYNSLMAQIEAGTDSPTLTNENVELLLQRYIHYSAHYDSFETLIAGRPIQIQLLRNMRPNAPEPSRERAIHLNLEDK